MALAVIYVIWLRRALHERSRLLEIMRSYSSLVENMPVLYARVELIFDPGGRIIDYVYREVNPTFEKYILPKEKYWERNTANSIRIIRRNCPTGTAN